MTNEPGNAWNAYTPCELQAFDQFFGTLADMQQSTADIGKLGREIAAAMQRRSIRAKAVCREYTEERFRELRDATCGTPATRKSWEESCQFLMDAIKDGHPWFHMYRAHPEEYKIEEDLAAGLWAICREDNILRWHHLRHVRRFYFQRYAFWRAGSINWRLWKGKQANFVWLYKDVLLLRAALALLLGYALVLGAGNTSSALRLLADKGPWQRIFAGSALSLVALVWLNARNQAGRGKHLLLPALAVAGGTAVWAVLYCEIANWAFGIIRWSFSWPEAAMISAAAVPLSILAQFFFGSERSLTDPL